MEAVLKLIRPLCYALLYLLRTFLQEKIFLSYLADRRLNLKVFLLRLEQNLIPFCLRAKLKEPPILILRRCFF